MQLLPHAEGWAEVSGSAGVVTTGEACLKPDLNTKDFPLSGAAHRAVPRYKASEVCSSFTRSCAMQTIVRVGVVIANNVLQVHGVDAQGKVITNRAIQRSKF